VVAAEAIVAVKVTLLATLADAADEESVVVVAAAARTVTITDAEAAGAKLALPP
jgi:hypothetical protein